MLTPRRATEVPAISRHRDGRSIFSKRLLEQFILHAQLGKHFLEPLVLVLNGLHLADHRRIHPAKLRSPFVERRAAHAMLATELRHRDTAIRLAKDRQDLRLAIFAALHPNSTRASCRENSTREAP